MNECAAADVGEITVISADSLPQRLAGLAQPSNSVWTRRSKSEEAFVNSSKEI